MSKKFFIETYGCQMNKSDSELMQLSMNSEGFIEVSDKNSADIIIYNTCSVRKNAEDRAYSNIRESKAHMRKKKGIVVASGCMAQRIGQKFLDDKIADLVLGPYSNGRVGTIVKNYIQGEKQRLFISQLKEEFTERLNPGLISSKETSPWHKWITITHGCENFCTYCIVPYVRGPLISFSSESIIDYVKRSAENGVFEITLLGQNVNQYGQDNGDVEFHKLLEQTAGINGIQKINFLTSHPKDFNHSIVDVIQAHDNIANSIHLPLQSGSDFILNKMNRKYSVDHYMEIVDKIKSTLKHYFISTDIIVGFPGESEKDFLDTLDIVKKVKYDEIFTYAYSPRLGTTASSLENQIPEKEKQNRLAELIKINREIAQIKLKSFEGMNERIIIERVSKKDDNKVMGRTFLNHPAVIDGNKNDIGKIFNIKIKELNGATFIAEKI